MKTIIALLLFIMAFSVEADASEGFNLNLPHNSALEQAWDNSVIITHQSGSRLASGVVLGSEKIGVKDYIYILSCGHIRSGTDLKNRESLFPRNSEADFQIYSNISLPMKYIDGGITPNGDAVAEAIAEEVSFAWGFLDWSEASDYGLLVFEVKGLSTRVGKMQFPAGDRTIKIRDKNYLIGFPAVMTRDPKVRKLAIENDGVITKRWSAGLITNISARRGYAQSSVDNLHGSSGGPVISETGKIIGILSATKDNQELSWLYSGSDEDLIPISGFYTSKKLEKFSKEQIKKFRVYATKNLNSR